MTPVSDAAPDDSHPAPRRRARSWTLFALLLGVLIAGSFGGLTAYSSRANSSAVDDPPFEIPSADSAEVPEAPADPETPAVDSPENPTVSENIGPVAPPPVEGKWIIDEGIRRIIEMRRDGTAVMDVKLDFLGSLVYGSELHIQLEWKRQQDRLTHSIVGGEPKNNVARLARDYGNTRTYEIVSLTEDELVLKDIDPSDPEVYHWKRLGD